MWVSIFWVIAVSQSDGGFAVAGGIVSGNGYAVAAGAIAYVDAVITMANGDSY